MIVIVFLSLPSGPGTNISNTIVLASLCVVTMRVPMRFNLLRRLALEGLELRAE